jgi:hypothetical protein
MIGGDQPRFRRQAYARDDSATTSGFASLQGPPAPSGAVDDAAPSSWALQWSRHQKELDGMCRQSDGFNFLVQLGTIILHTVAMALTVKGTLLSFEAALFVWPMLTVATVHYGALRSRLYHWQPTASITALEILYFTVAVSSMPMWFLQQPVTSASSLARTILLGPASCLVGWNM